MASARIIDIIRDFNNNKYEIYHNIKVITILNLQNIL